VGDPGLGRRQLLRRHLLRARLRPRRRPRLRHRLDRRPRRRRRARVGARLRSQQHELPDRRSPRGRRRHDRRRLAHRRLPGRQRRRQSARGAHRGLPVGLSSCCRPRRYRRRALAPAPRARAGRWRWTASSRSSGARRLCSRVQRCSGSAARHSRRPAWRPLIRQRLLSRRNASTKPHERRDRLPEERSLVDARGDAASRVQSKPGPYFVSRRAFLREPCERRFSPLLREHVVERGAKAERLEG
jgi:hypothetical protein